MKQNESMRGWSPGEEPPQECSPLIERVMMIALGELGVMEEPGEANSGPRIDLYLKSVGLGPGQAWCAAFVYWCFDQACRELRRVNPVVRSGSCMKHWHCTRGERILAKEIALAPDRLLPGDIFVLDRGAGLGHTGLILKVDGPLLDTLEGNSHPMEGAGGVYRTRRQARLISPGVIRYR